jgi:hypothetical protein
VAAELSSINYRDIAITLTPSDSGRFEVYLDGKKVYDRKETGAVDFLPALREIHKIRDSIKQIFADSPPAPALLLPVRRRMARAQRALEPAPSDWRREGV